MSTPIKDSYKKRLSSLETSTKLTDTSQLVVGSYVNVPRTSATSGCTGFVKKINRVNVVIETTYGGYGENDVKILELTIKKADIAEFFKPQQNEIK